MKKAAAGQASKAATGQRDRPASPKTDPLSRAHLKQAEEAGIPVGKLLSDALRAEAYVAAFERRSGKTLEWGWFARTATPQKMTEEDWAALDVLAEVISSVPEALDCWRVRYSVGWLRANRLLHEEKEVPPRLRKILRRVGAAVADPKKLGFYVRGKRTADRRGKVLGAWKHGKGLDSEARDGLAQSIGLADWPTLERMARRYLADKRS